MDTYTQLEALSLNIGQDINLDTQTYAFLDQGNEKTDPTTSNAITWISSEQIEQNNRDDIDALMEDIDSLYKTMTDEHNTQNT